MAMDLDSDETITHDCLFNHRPYASPVTLRINESKTIKAIRPAVDYAGDLAISDRIVGMKGREQHRAVNSRSGRSPQIFFQRRIGIPWTSKSDRTMRATSRLATA